MDADEAGGDRFFGGDPPCWAHLLDEEGRLDRPGTAAGDPPRRDDAPVDPEAAAPADLGPAPRARGDGTGRPDAPPHL